MSEPLTRENIEALRLCGRSTTAEFDALCALALKGLDAGESEPYCWVYDSPGHFDPQNGGEPPYTDFSDEPKPGYRPLYTAPQPAQVAVKPLVWKPNLEHEPEHLWTGEIALGLYYTIDSESRVYRLRRGRFLSEYGPDDLGLFPTLDAAKAAAQVDCASCISPALAPSPADGAVEAHPDDAAIDRFAVAMKAKLKWEREECGRSGWQDMSAEALSRLLYEHLPKEDPVDVANLAMMLHQNGQRIIYSAALKGDTP